MAIYPKKFISENPITTNGFWKGSTNLEGRIRQVIVQPKSPDTLYNFGIKDEDDFTCFIRQNVRGLLVADNLSIIIMPGEKSLIIEEATRDESFSIKIVYQL